MFRPRYHMTSDGYSLPEQPEGTDFPIRAYLRIPPRDTLGDKVSDAANERRIGLTLGAVGLSALATFFNMSGSNASLNTQNGLFILGASLTGLSAMFLTRSLRPIARQLIYFDHEMLIVDSYNNMTEAFSVNKVRVEMTNLRGDVVQQGGDLLRVNDGRNRTYIGAFLDPSELPGLKAALEHGLNNHPLRIRPSVTRYMPRRRPSGPAAEEA